MIEFEDRIYGSIKIENPLILELISTKPFQRLKQINQYGGVNFVFEESYQVSRYEHSIGVWYTTKELGGDQETQVTALLHDVGHFAFSHLVDQAKEDAKENVHEFSQRDLEGWEEVEDILAANGLTHKNPSEYKLIKTSLPDIGTDRFDYAIRDLEAVVPKADKFGKRALEAIKIIDGEIVFTDKDIAKEFAERGNRAMWHVIYDPQIAVIYQSLIELLRMGINNGWLTRKELLKTDREVFELIKTHESQFDSKYMRVFEEIYNTAVVDSDHGDYDFKHVKLKARYFDPRVELADGKLMRISEIDKNSKKFLEKYKQIFEDRKEGIGIRLIY
jgi:hypothetical protein